MSTRFWLNGVPASIGAVSFRPDDPVVMWGESFFETARVHRGKIIGRQLHSSRLKKSLRTFYGDRFRASEFDAVWASAHAAAEAHYAGGGEDDPAREDAKLKIMAAPSLATGADGDLRYITSLAPWTPPTRWTYMKGISACFASIPHPMSGPAGKSSSMHWSRLAQREAALRGTDEAILTRGDDVVEASWSSVVAKREEDQAWMTPPAHAGGLDSTTLRLLERRGLKVERRMFTKSELLVCDSLVLLSSLSLAVGVAKLEYKEFFMPDAAASEMRRLLLEERAP